MCTLTRHNCHFAQNIPNRTVQTSRCLCHVRMLYRAHTLSRMNNNIHDYFENESFLRSVFPSEEHLRTTVRTTTLSSSNVLASLLPYQPPSVVCLKSRHLFTHTDFTNHSFPSKQKPQRQTEEHLQCS